MAITGDLKELTFPEIIQTYCVGGRTARLSIQYPACEGVFYFQHGELVDAHLGNLVGLDAFYRALAYEEGRFRIDLDITCESRTIFESWTSAMIEGLRLLDEERHTGVSEVPDLDLDPDFGPAPDLRPTEVFAGVDLRATRPLAPPPTLIEDALLDALETRFPGGPLATGGREAPGPAPASAPLDGVQRVQHLLASTGVIQQGVVIDDDGVVLCEIGDAGESLARLAFLVAGLDALVTTQFDLGACEGAWLELDNTPTLFARAHHLACAFVPVQRVPVARAISEARHALDGAAGMVL